MNINTRTPRTSRAPRGRGWSGSSGGPVPASSGPGSSRRTCARCSGPARRGPRPAARRVAARRRALQDTRGRQGREKGQAQARRRPGGGGPGNRQRPRGVVQRQGQGGGQDGLRVPQRGQPHIPAHAQVLRHQAGPAGAAGGMRPLSTNTNEGSMSMFAWKSGRRAARVARNQTCQDGRLPEG